MKFCQPHWDSLRTAIAERKLTHLVAKSGEAAMQHAVAELEDRAGPEDYDPLMAAHWMIVNRALECGGLYLMTGDYCPLCELVSHTTPGTDTEWITGCCDSIRTYCEELGLTRDERYA